MASDEPYLVSIQYFLFSDNIPVRSWQGFLQERPQGDFTEPGRVCIRSAMILPDTLSVELCAKEENARGPLRRD